MAVSVLYVSGSEICVNETACDTFLDGADVGAAVGVPGAAVGVPGAAVGVPVATVGLLDGVPVVGLSVVGASVVGAAVVGLPVGWPVGAPVGWTMIELDTLCTTRPEPADSPSACRVASRPEGSLCAPESWEWTEEAVSASGTSTWRAMWTWSSEERRRAARRVPFVAFPVTLPAVAVALLDALLVVALLDSLTDASTPAMAGAVGA